MNCEKCDKVITSSFKFCPYCGAANETGSPEALLNYITTQKERLVAGNKDAERWIAWEAWVSLMIGKETKYESYGRISEDNQHLPDSTNG